MNLEEIQKEFKGNPKGNPKGIQMASSRDVKEIQKTNIGNLKESKDNPKGGGLGGSNQPYKTLKNEVPHLHVGYPMPFRAKSCVF